MSSHDPRIAELEQVAHEEGIVLPMPADLIIYFERMGKVVDLVTGQVLDRVTVGTPTPSGRAVAYLLLDQVGDIFVT